MNDLYEAYVNRELVLEPTGKGKLNELTFSVKDVFDIQGYTNAAGNPDWYRTHGSAADHASAIKTLLKQGATLHGTTHTDELMYSLNGENYHYGTPTNPKAPDHIPGGSSSGSAVAVAGEMVDFALGTDTGGSVRIPSSYCGIVGFRPTHDAVDIQGVIPLAKTFDTVGWMAREMDIMLKVGEVLLKEEAQIVTSPFSRILIGADAWELLLDKKAENMLDSLLLALQEHCPSINSITISKEGLTKWANCFRILQAMEIWSEHREWIETVKPRFGPGISDRFLWASTLKQEDHHEQFVLREKVQYDLDQMLGEDGILIIPTAPGHAPLRNLSSDELEEYRGRAMQLTCIAGLAGLPQLTLPIGNVNDMPIGLSLIANRNQDLKLLHFAKTLLEKL